MDEKQGTEEKKQEKFRCKICDRYYAQAEARKKAMACCGQELTQTEDTTENPPVPFGP